MIPLFAKLIAPATICLVAAAGLAPASAAESSSRTVASVAVAGSKPVPSAQALAHGVRAGQGAPMGWERGGATVPQVSPTSTGTSGTTSTRQFSTTTTTTTATSPLKGIDVSNYQPTVNWTSYANGGYKFAYVKATEGPYCDGSSYKSSTFSSQYSGAGAAGLVRGAYHFAIPNCSTGKRQADFFAANGGGWTPDGKTLPGVLDIEYDPYTAQDHTNSCYGLTPSQMVNWIKGFSNEYVADTGVYPIIYSTTGWWSTCTGNSSALSRTNPFWIASYTGSTTSGPGALPSGVQAWTFWQYGDGASPYNFCGTNFDCDQFNGGTSQLHAIDTTYSVDPHVASAWTSSMGYPTGRVSQVTAFGITGYIQRFPNGYALVNSSYGTYVVNGAILGEWVPTSSGWPTGNAAPVTAGGTTGVQQNFGRGTSSPDAAYWNQLSRTTFWLGGGILARYNRLGGPTVLGWPIAAATSETDFNVRGWTQRLQSGRALIASSYGVFESSGQIFLKWAPSLRGWPTADLKATTYRGAAGWLQTFQKGSSGSDFAFCWRSTSAVSWINGTP